METTENKGILIAYKHLKEGSIAHSNEWMDITSKDFEQIKKDCARYVAKREKASSFATTSIIHGSITTQECFNNIDNTLEASFGKYSDAEKVIAKSIIGYNSEKFIKHLKRRNITYNEIQSFISIINFAKENPEKGLNLLLLNSDLMNQFYKFAAYSKYCLQYGDYVSIINKLEETYIFENQNLQKALERGKCKTK